MAITLNAPTVTNPSAPSGVWCANGTSADMQGNETLKAAPGAGYALRIRKVHINCAVATTVVLNEGTSAVLGPFSFGAAAAGLSNVSIDFDTPIQLAENTALNCDAGGAGAVNAIVVGDVVRLNV